MEARLSARWKNKSKTRCKSYPTHSMNAENRYQWTGKAWEKCMYVCMYVYLLVAGSKLQSFMKEALVSRERCGGSEEKRRGEMEICI